MTIQDCKVGLRVKPRGDIQTLFNDPSRLNWTGTIAQVGLVPSSGTVTRAGHDSLAQLVVVNLDRPMVWPEGDEPYTTVVYHPSNLDRVEHVNTIDAYEAACEANNKRSVE